MDTEYNVKPGDSLSKIARNYGLSSWRDIYFYPPNESFRRKRPNPDNIYPGDILRIPVNKAGPGKYGLQPKAITDRAPLPVANITAAGAPIVRSVDRPRVIDSALRVKLDNAQFYWKSFVKYDPDPQAAKPCVEIGFLQTMFKSEIVFMYAEGPDDKNPRSVKLRESKMPIRDHGKNGSFTSVWANPRSDFLGRCTPRDTLPSPPLPPINIPGAGSDKNLIVIEFADDPGPSHGRMNHPSYPTKSFRELREDLQWITWVAAKHPAANPLLIESYTFIQHAIWSVTRTTVMGRDAYGAVPVFTRNETKLLGWFSGKGVLNPILEGPDANQSIIVEEAP